MPRGKRANDDHANDDHANDDHANDMRPAGEVSSPSATTDAHALASVFRHLADRAETDPDFARHLLGAMRPEKPAPQPKATPAAEPPILDPFALLRSGGANELTQTLADLDLAALRQIVRAHHLDPARLSARWTARERVIELIVEQAQARLNRGRAFERV